MSQLHPVYEIRYREFSDDVIVQTFSIDGKPHSGAPKRMKWVNLPIFMFQLIDAGYISTERVKSIAYTSVSFFSPEFVAIARKKGLSEQLP